MSDADLLEQARKKLRGAARAYARTADLPGRAAALVELERAAVVVVIAAAKQEVRVSELDELGGRFSGSRCRQERARAVSKHRSLSSAESSARIFGGGISRHGASCGCPYCMPEQRYAAAQPAPEAPHATPSTGSSDREHLLDVAAAAQRDSWDLAGDRGLIEAICRDYVMLGAQAERDAETIADLKRRLAELTAAAQEANRDAAAALERERIAYRNADS